MTVRLFVCFSTQSPGAGIIGTRQPGVQGLYNLRLYQIPLEQILPKFKTSPMKTKLEILLHGINAEETY